VPKKRKDIDIPGFSWKKNPNNEFAAVKLHYTADPKKRSKEWKKKASFGMTQKAWDTEMELSWETYAGEPVYGKEFSPDAHVLQKRVEPDPRYPFLLRGWDFGGNHSCVVVQYLRGKVMVIDEFPNMGYNTRRIAREINEICHERYGEDFVFTEIIDPSGMWEGKTSDGKACGDVMRDLGLNLVPGIQDVTRRIDAVMTRVITLQDGKPQLQINPGCHMLIQGMKGGYHYPEKETKNQKTNRPEKNEYSHIIDALQYVCTRLDPGHDAARLEFDLSKLKGNKYDL